MSNGEWLGLLNAIGFMVNACWAGYFIEKRAYRFGVPWLFAAIWGFMYAWRHLNP